jgi:hypothetical protein
MRRARRSEGATTKEKEGVREGRGDLRQPDKEAERMGGDEPPGEGLKV